MTWSGSYHDLVVVVRASGERTRDGCLGLLAREVPSANIREVTERPFEASLRECLKIGTRSGVEWMLTVDADVLVRPGAVRELYEAAKALPKNFIQVEGLILDKLYGGYRKAGHRIYRTAYLGEALKAIPRDGTEIRPEYAMLERMASVGHPSREASIVFGIHDFEQYYGDLYRKAFVHGQKHSHWLQDAVPAWRSAASNDSDLRVVLKGFCDGLQAQELARIDTQQYEGAAREAVGSLGLTEKTAIQSGAEGLASLSDQVNNLLARHPMAKPLTTSVRLAENLKRLGFLRWLPYLAGGVLLALGSQLRRVAERS